MRSNEAAVARGEKPTSDIKKEVGQAADDQSWKTEELKKAEDKAKAARAPGGDKDKTAGLSVPQDGKS